MDANAYQEVCGVGFKVVLIYIMSVYRFPTDKGHQCHLYISSPANPGKSLLADDRCSSGKHM